MNNHEFNDKLQKEIEKQDAMLTHNVIVANKETINKMKASPPIIKPTSNAVGIYMLSENNTNIYIENPYVPTGTYILIEDEKIKSELLKKKAAS